ncbi:uncharacterized protein [Typha latifolia]|uniref:uncharacterized protein n=1 Tax=Typha latifolia TaxID=4733 RepID=UPI003C2F2C52
MGHKYGYLKLWAKKHKKKGISGMYRHLIEASNLLREGYTRNINSGKNTSIINDPWIFIMPIALKPTYVNMNVSFGKKIVARLIHKGNWNTERLLLWFGPILSESIRDILLPRLLQNDSWIWLSDPKGKASVKSEHDFLAKPKGDHSNKDKWDTLWLLPLALRIQTFIWKLTWNRLPTNDRLIKRDMPDSPLCDICKKDIETTQYLFMECETAKHMWDLTMSTYSFHISFNGDWIKGDWMKEGKNLPRDNRNLC